MFWSVNLHLRHFLHLIYIYIYIYVDRYIHTYIRTYIHTYILQHQTYSKYLSFHIENLEVPLTRRPEVHPWNTMNLFHSISLGFQSSPSRLKEIRSDICILSQATWTVHVMPLDSEHGLNYRRSESSWLLRRGRQRWEKVSLFFFSFFFRCAQIFSTISTAFLNPSHGETQSAAYSAFLGERGGFLWGLATLPPPLGWRTAQESSQGGASPITVGGSFGGSRMKDDITRSVVMRCHRPYWFLDRLASGGVATADCVCCLFSPLAFLPWCNWHRVYRSGNYCNTWDSSGQWGGHGGVGVGACVRVGGGCCRAEKNHWLLMEPSYAFRTEA